MIKYLSDPYILITFLTASVILIFAFCLLGFSVPRDPELKNYRISRYLLACAYAVLALTGLCEIIAGTKFDKSELTITLTLSIASFQAFLFTYSMITLIDFRFMTRQRVLRQVVPITIFSIILLYCHLYVKEEIYDIVFYILCSCYCIQLIYYIILFRREYRKYRNQMDNYFSEDEQKRMRWINITFCMALSIGIMAIVSLFVPVFVYLLFTIWYTIFYIYFAMKYINYVSIFHYFVPAMTISEQDYQPLAIKDIGILVDNWISNKGFTKNDITLDSLAAELKTNRTYLSNYINTDKGCNFKTWVSRLRIEEAQQLLINQPATSVSAVGEIVGIADKSSFFRQFMNIAGCTPGEFRNNAK